LTSKPPPSLLFYNIYGGAFTAPFELYFKSNLSLSRLGALPYPVCISRPALGQGSFGARLAARFVVMQCVTGSAGWRLGGGSRQPSRPNQVFKKERLSAPALNSVKYRYEAGCRASPD